MPTPNTPETYSIDDFAAKIKQRRPDLAQMDNHALVSQLVKARPEFQNFIRTEDLQREVNPNAPTEENSGVIASAVGIGKAALSFFGGMAKNAIKPAETPDEAVIAANAGRVPGASNLALLYKRSFYDPGKAAQEQADNTRLSAIARGERTPDQPLTVGQKADIIGNAATAGINYLAPAGFGSALLGEAIFTPQVIGGAASQAGQGDLSGAGTTLFAGVLAPKAIGKIAEQFKGKATPSVQDIQAEAQPAPQQAQPAAPSQAAQGANYRPEVKYKPSEKATTMSTQAVDRGPEFNAQSFQEEINRNNEILRNPKATDVDKQVATDRLRDAREGMARVQGGGPVVPQEIATPAPEVKAAPVETQAPPPPPQTAEPVSPEAVQRQSKYTVTTDSNGIRWASDGEDKVSIPKSVADADIDAHADKAIPEQKRIKAQLFSEPATVDQPSNVVEMPAPPSRTDVSSQMHPLAEAANIEHEGLKSAKIVNAFTQTPDNPRGSIGVEFGWEDGSKQRTQIPYDTWKEKFGPLSKFENTHRPVAVDAQASQPVQLTPEQKIDPTKAPDTQAAPINETPKTAEQPVAAAEPEAFPLDHFSRRMRTMEDATTTLSQENLHPAQKAYWSDFLKKQQEGLTSDLNKWAGGNPDTSLVENEIKRLNDQAQNIRETLQSDPLAKQMRAEMSQTTRFRRVTLEGQGPEGTDLRTWERMGSDTGLDNRENFHEALGDKTRTATQVEKPGVDDEGVRQRAQARINEIKKAITDRIEEMKEEPHLAMLSADERLREALREGNYTDELKTLRGIVGRPGEYKTATNPSGRGTLGKGKATLDEAGVVRPAGKVGEVTLDYANKVFERRNRKIPSPDEFLRKADQLEQRGQLLDNLLKKLKQKRGLNPESGAIGDARAKGKATLQSPIQDTEFMRKEAQKHADLASWDISDDKPAGQYGFISPDGKLWIEGADGLEHQDMARRLLRNVEYSRPEEGPVNAMLRDGWIRKASGKEYQAHRLGPRQLSAIEMSMIRDGRFGQDTIIDSMGPRGIKALHIDSGWEDLASEVDKIKRSDPSWRDAAQAGVGGSEIMGGVSAGMIGGYAAGHAVAGPIGGIVGGSVGALVGGSLPALLRHPVVRGVLTSLSDEVRDLGYGSYQTGKQVATDLTHFLAPRMGASEDSLKTMYAMKGAIAKAGWETSKLLEVYQKHVEALPRDAQIDFIDRMKTGQPQLTPELDDLAKTIRSVDQADYEAMKAYRPNLPFLENHFRLLYDTLPGVTDDGFKGWIAKRPLQGSKGMLHQHVYDTLSDAMAAGGKPVTTNPIDMFLMSHVDAQRFIHAQAMWDTAKQLGLRDFVKLGDKPGPDMVKLDDSIAKVYFPASSGEGLVNPGEHYVTQDFGRLLNNYLSKDYVRANTLGKAIVDAKNIATGWELFGPFHGVAMSLAAISGNFALGMERAFNLGVRNLDAGEFGRGVKEMAGSVMGSRSSFLDGKNLQEFGDAINRYKNGDGKALTDFSNSDAGQKFLQHYPDAEGLLGDAFMGGLNMKMSQDVKSDIVKGMMENFRNNEYLQAGAKAPFAALNKAMDPLFDNYIPRLKLGMFVKDMSLQLKDRADDILAGKTTREKIARQTVDRIENTFGEMNFDNLFWNRTFKTSMQMLYRSVTWRLGTLRLLKDAVKNQAGNIYEGAVNKEIPRLDPNFGYLAAETLVVGGLSAVIMKTLAGKNPQNVTDILHPQTGDRDSRGKPVRVNVPAYMSRDIPQILSEPSGIFKYATGGNSALVQRALESWNNKDFSGSWVANPNDPQYKQFAVKVAHLLPSLMVSNTMDRLDQEGASRDRKLLAVAGFSPAPKSLDLSAAELQAQSRLMDKFKLQAGQDPQTMAKVSAVNRLTAALQNHRPAGEIFRQGVKDGTLTPDDIGKISDKIATPLVVQLTKNPKMNLEDVMGVYRVATPQEKALLKPVIFDKLDQLTSLPPERRGQVWQQVQQAFQGAHQ